MAIGARFAKYVNPVLQALRALGGSGRPGEVGDWVATALGVSDAQREVENVSGGSQFDNDVAWARFYLVRSGYLHASKRGVWSLTDKGRTAGDLDDGQINDLIRAVQAATATVRAINPPSTPPVDNASQVMPEAEDVSEGVAPIALYPNSTRHFGKRRFTSQWRVVGWKRIDGRRTEIKNRLKVLRAERGWSQGDLAEHLGVSRQTVNAIETGRYDPSLPLTFAIGGVFSQTIEAIFTPDRPNDGGSL